MCIMPNIEFWSLPYLHAFTCPGNLAHQDSTCAPMVYSTLPYFTWVGASYHICTAMKPKVGLIFIYIWRLLFTHLFLSCGSLHPQYGICCA